MCLNTVDTRYFFARNRSKPEIGYKVLELCDGDLHLPYLSYKYNKGTPLSVNTLMKSSKSYLKGNDKKYYLTGFHIFVHLYEAVEFLRREVDRYNMSIKYNPIYKVKYTHKVAEGKQWDKDIVIARQMTIIEDRIPLSSIKEMIKAQEASDIAFLVNPL